MFNMNKVLEAAKNLGADVSTLAVKYVPTSLSRDKKFANAYGCIMSLMICADREVEEDETIAAMDFIRRDENLRGLGMTVEGVKFYSGFISELEPTFENVPRFTVETTRLIEEHISIIKEESQKVMLKGLVNHLCGSQANEAEKSMRDSILLGLK